ncbi:MAG: YraN family protein [Candidatus Omnitrophota bacterium]
MNTKQIGKIGENLAVEFLKSNNYNILERNYHNRIGEIDIIAENSSVLCFIEVKTRANDNFGLPQEAISKSKQRKISQTALAYLKARNRLKGNFRFDVIAVMLNEAGENPDINLIKNAFDLDRQYFI